MRLFTIALLSGICLGPILAAPASAQWFGKKTAKKPEPVTPSPTQGFTGYIRRLTADARAAAQRGDLQTARSLAERAYKISLTCKPMLVNEPDCSPQAIEALLKQLGSTTAQPGTLEAVAQTPPATNVDLAPLLDATPNEHALPIPPSPAPPMETRPAKIAARSQGNASNKRVSAGANITRNKSRRAPNPSQAAGFLALQTDWLAPDADSHQLIEDLSQRATSTVSEERRVHRDAPADRSAASNPRRIPRPKAIAAAPSASPEAPAEEFASETEEPEVTTALGRPGDRWQLDVETSQHDAPEESMPQLTPPASQPGEMAHAPTDDSRIGVWSSASNPAAARHGQHVVSLSDFLTPTSSPAGHSVSAIDDEAPRMIETDFRQTATPIPVEPRGLASETNTPRAALSRGPAVSYQDGPAIGWLDSSTTADIPPTTTAHALLIDLSWSEWTATRKAVAAGMALLITGLVLFGLSFRWT